MPADSTYDIERLDDRSELRYFGPADNWFWVWRCDEEERRPDVLRVLMWVVEQGEVVGLVSYPHTRPGKILTPVFMGTYKHLNDLAPDELEIVGAFRKHGLAAW